MSTFNGERTVGPWVLTGTGDLVVLLIQLNYCQLGPFNCPRDVMKALTNIPGFRIDSGIVYYTEDVFDAFGNFKQVTISRPIDGLYSK